MQGNTAGQKSARVAILLTALFGPLGMFYSTVSGAIIMLIVSVVVASMTLWFGLILVWPVCIVYAALAANEHNRKLAGAYVQRPDRRD